MSKLYRIIFIVLIIALVSLNLALFFNSERVFSYLHNPVEVESAESIMERIDEESRRSVLDLSMIESQKFKDLREFTVDFSDFDVGDIDSGDDDGDIGTGTEDGLPDFEVGNNNPFQPF
jgi:hypothetical protein